ncbi:OLC1v1016660C1 [Oldenlandia corymbosa var. corymbosa]|uniref:Conserved oligomeric Golgi complex subunit 1 n=1 Tax=Oldenlandia corymbosa var. corymbosa TaxID=529605 RepID=A0AAV1E7N1_OLDCO|nr:OLC1v1016660C1 [Oldenlandia corymbosa var. corymbosa]
MASVPAPAGGGGGRGGGYRNQDAELLFRTKPIAEIRKVEHQWPIVESFRAQISQRTRERLVDQAVLLGLGINAYADALSALAIIDELCPEQVLNLFLDSRKLCILQRLNACSRNVNADNNDVTAVFSQVLSIIQTILDSPSASQLFGGILNPDEEVRLWTAFREKLEGTMVPLDRGFIAKTCSDWLRKCGKEIVNNISGICELVLGDDCDLWADIYEDSFLHRMKAIIDTEFQKLNSVVNVLQSVRTIVQKPDNTLQGYLDRLDAGGIWFIKPNCKRVGSLEYLKEIDVSSGFNGYFGLEVIRIRDAIDSGCARDKCYRSMSNIVGDVRSELDLLSSELQNMDDKHESELPATIIVQRSLFIGRLMFAFPKHSKHIAIVLGSPRLWMNQMVADTPFNSPAALRYSRSSFDSYINDSLETKMFDSPRRQVSFASSVLFGIDDNPSPQLEELICTTQDLCLRAHNLWTFRVPDELARTFSANLEQDDALLGTALLRGWKNIVIKQEQPSESTSNIKISLPSMPSTYVTSFLFKACEEIHIAGGHDKATLQSLAAKLLGKVIGIYKEFLEGHEKLSDEGILQILLDLRFLGDVLSRGDVIENVMPSKVPKQKVPFRFKQETRETKSAIREGLDGLVNRLSEGLDPIDWLTFEPYLWENARKSYLKHAVIYEFFVQLNRLYTDSAQKLPSLSDSMPRFKYIHISAPALSSTGKVMGPALTSVNDVTSRSDRSNYKNDEPEKSIGIEDNTNLGMAAPLLKSIMQVGTKLEELRQGSFLTIGQVGTLGDILTAPAAGLLSSLTLREQVQDWEDSIE